MLENGTWQEAHGCRGVRPEIADPEMRKILSDEISDHAKKLFYLYEDDPLAFANYFLSAKDYEKGLRDQLGLELNPGPMIAQRCANNLERLIPKKRFSFRSHTKPSGKELFPIISIATGACWYLNGDLK